MKLFRRKSKKTEPGAGSTVPVNEAPPDDAQEGSPTAEAARAVSANGGSVELAMSWPYPLPVMFAPPWAIDELIRVEEYSQDGACWSCGLSCPSGTDPDKDVRLTVVEGRLSIQAERHEQGEVERDGFMLRELRYGTFARSAPGSPPGGSTVASITATYKDGLLEVRIPAPRRRRPHHQPGFRSPCPSEMRAHARWQARPIAPDGAGPRARY